jgi:hypothetical protein
LKEKQIGLTEKINRIADLPFQIYLIKTKIKENEEEHEASRSRGRPCHVRAQLNYLKVPPRFELGLLDSTFLGPNGTRFARAISGPEKSLDFQGPPLPMPLVMMLHPSKSLRTAP